jgi:SAM-dependent methyltransferase
MIRDRKGISMSQRDIFLESEGDAWFERNRSVVEKPANSRDDPILRTIDELGISGSAVLEIGCSSGYRLAAIKPKQFPQRCGLDPSAKAIDLGRARFPGLELYIGTGDQLPFEAKSFDLIIFGFCLYVCSPEDLFRVAEEANRVMKNEGYIVIYDFCTRNAYSKSYKHHAEVASNKMFFPNMFLWHPWFTLISHRVFDHTKKSTAPAVEDEAVAVSVIIKSPEFGRYPLV